MDKRVLGGSLTHHTPSLRPWELSRGTLRLQICVAHSSSLLPPEMQHFGLLSPSNPVSSITPIMASMVASLPSTSSNLHDQPTLVSLLSSSRQSCDAIKQAIKQGECRALRVQLLYSIYTEASTPHFLLNCICLNPAYRQETKPLPEVYPAFTSYSPPHLSQLRLEFPKPSLTQPKPCIHCPLCVPSTNILAQAESVPCNARHTGTTWQEMVLIRIIKLKWHSIPNNTLRIMLLAKTTLPAHRKTVYLLANKSKHQHIWYPRC